MESTGLDQCFWHYFLLVKPLRPVAFFPGGISWWFPLQAGCRSGWDPSKPVGSKTSWCFCSIQAAAQEGFVCPIILAFVRTQILCCSMCGKQSVSFMSEGSKACFLCSKQLEGRVTTPLVSPSYRVLPSISYSHVFGLQLCNWSKKRWRDLIIG